MIRCGHVVVVVRLPTGACVRLFHGVGKTVSSVSGSKHFHVFIETFINESSSTVLLFLRTLNNSL